MDILKICVAEEMSVFGNSCLHLSNRFGLALVDCEIKRVKWPKETNNFDLYVFLFRQMLLKARNWYLFAVVVMAPNNVRFPLALHKLMCSKVLDYSGT
jgi:hypothetical protein